MSAKENSGRQSRMWWVVSELGSVQYLKGYSCAPANPDYWWVPEAGYSLQVGQHLFDHKQEAIAKGIKELDQELSHLQAQLLGLKQRLK